jgi:hypothetical protein
MGSFRTWGGDVVAGVEVAEECWEDVAVEGGAGII